MIIKSIYLKGYKPFFLNPIKSINITFDSNLVLIIATNGAGKSSLLRELTPLPATPTMAPLLCSTQKLFRSLQKPLCAC